MTAQTGSATLAFVVVGKQPDLAPRLRNSASVTAL